MARWIHFLLAFAVPALASQQKPLGVKDRPNIVFILTDDQDLHIKSLEYMPLVQKHLVDRGTSYNRHYCSTAICCPSRVTLWTGKNAHNTNVTDVFPPYGGYPKFVDQGLNENYLPVWLQEAGYSTFYAGKLFNAHSVDNYADPFPKGFTSSDFLLDPYTYQYLNATFQRNREEPVSWSGHYSTDVLAVKASGLLDEAVALGKPFFLTVATNAPHSNVPTFDPEDGLSGLPIFTAPIPAKRHENLFADVRVPRTENFNPDKHGGASWIKDLPQLNDTVLDYNDYFYRSRLRALQAVDELVEGVVQQLDDLGILDNTYIIYSTDNGFHISQHRLHPGKECGFEEDIHIPLIVRGPNVPEGETADIVTAHTDLAPTILKIAGQNPRDDFDGTAIPLDREGIAQASLHRQEHVNVEFWGDAIPEGKFGYSVDEGKIIGLGLNNTYKGLRLIGDGYDLYYSVWCTNEHELFDLVNDPYQVRNIYPHESRSGAVTTILGIPLSKIIPRLDALLLVTKSCKAATCVEPWKVLHPQGDVGSLSDALSPAYDAFYEEIKTKVAYDRCELGYIVESEGPQSPPIFGQ
ncbi:MAG: hypothetical protein M1837_000850 [Sclerophora amabilis]|nr:MAG: hypothetical protein M1837_000850 [Sclerophora amabilis]